ncbi:membrane-associated Zn-dependent protease 1, partial [Yersinia bercovieri]
MLFINNNFTAAMWATEGKPMKGYRYVRGFILLIGVFLSSPLLGKGEVHL